jgi:hypothetical protein
MSISSISNGAIHSGVSPRLAKRPLRAKSGRPDKDAIDLGCIKTCTSKECTELFSLSSSLSSGRKAFWFSNLRFALEGA